MKRLISLVVILAFFYSGINAQIALEKEYSVQKASDLQFTRLISSSTKYFLLINDTLKIYDLNHTIYKSITIPSELTGSPYWIYYVSDSLFVINPKIEYLVQFWNNNTSSYNVKIFDEDGLKLLEQNYQLHDGLVVQLENPIILNTPTGTKLILRSESEKKVRIFSLPGKLPTPLNIMNDNSINNELSDAFPNPATDYSRINYKLPDNIKDGQIVIYDLSGNEILKYAINKYSDHVTVSTLNLPAGTYLYSLNTAFGSFGGKKIVVIK